MSILTVIGIVFVILKLVGVIAWSWWLVTLPFWIIIAFMIVSGGVILACGGLWAVLASLFSLFSSKK